MGVLLGCLLGNYSPCGWGNFSRAALSVYNASGKTVRVQVSQGGGVGRGKVYMRERRELGGRFVLFFIGSKASN